MSASAGAMLLNLRRKLRGGPSASYYREVVRPQILKTAPVTGTADRTAEIHVMTRSDDCLDLLWALKSFYKASRRAYMLVIHDDGSLSDAHIQMLSEHFPGARIIRRYKADAEIAEVLKVHPRCLTFRKTNLLSPKVFDFVHYLASDRMIIFDSDLLFFREPVEFLSRVENPRYTLNTFNGDVADGYAISKETAEAHIGERVTPMINSGFGLIHKNSIRLDWCEEFLGIPNILGGHFWRIEQTLIALCSSRYGVELLPEEYRVSLGNGINGKPMRHFVGAVRNRMYADGFRFLVREQFLVS